MSEYSTSEGIKALHATGEVRVDSVLALGYYLCERRADRQDATQDGFADPYKIKSPRWDDLEPRERAAYIIVARDFVEWMEGARK